MEPRLEAPLSVFNSAALFLPQQTQAKSCQGNLETAAIGQSQTSTNHNIQTGTRRSFCQGDKCLFIHLQYFIIPAA